ncbi:MAG: class F sortase [Nocardioides sp.]|nr:class F sortase [Nocardioides sp.]
MLPAEIRIPAIGVTSQVTQIGLNPDGTLAVPQPGPDYDKAAWYEGSPTPGQTGPSIIEGHVDSAKNGPSVFYDLGKLTPGATIDITRQDGSVVTFVIDEVTEFPKDAFPTERVYGNVDRPELRLITCGGEFDSKRGRYVNNTVVFAHQA